MLTKTFVTICTSIIVIFNLPVNNLINCETTGKRNHHTIEPLRQLDDGSDLGSTIETISSIGPIERIDNDGPQINWLISSEKSDNAINPTELSIELSSSISSNVDYYPLINGWCPDCCDEDEVFVKSEQKCLKKSFIADDCISSDQCIVPQSTCLRNMCVCIDYFVDFSRNKCTPIHNTAIEIYKITMIFASSCLALILLIFLACILRKSYCPADSSHHQGANRSTINDLFTIYPGTSGSPNELFSSLTPAEKPPSYNETMRMINQEIGTPPPAYHNIFYTESSSSSTTTTNQQSTTSSSSQPSQSTNCNNGLTPATQSTQSTTTINAQNHHSSSSSSFSQLPPSTPSIVTINQGKVNSAFDCDS